MLKRKKNRYEGIKYDYGSSKEIKTDFGSNAEKIANDYAKRMQMAAKARAARAAAMSDPIYNVITPLTVDLFDYTHIAIVGATCISLYKPKDSYLAIGYNFRQSALKVISTRYYDKKQFRRNPSYLRDIKNPKWVYVTYKESIQGVDDYRTLTIRDYQNKILYKVETRNIPSTEVVSVLTDM